MPSKCLLKKFEESIEDIKLIYEFYCENGGDLIEEMIPPVKYLLACISDIFNDGINSTKGFYSVFERVSRIEGMIDGSWDDFDKGLIFLIQKLNKKSLCSVYQNSFERLKPFYNINSLVIMKKEEILNLLRELEENVKFKLYQEDLYTTRIRFKPKLPEICSEYDESINKQPSPVESPDGKNVMNSSFISMEAVDVKLLQEREMRNDFGFLNKLKYNSIRFINNFRISKPLRSDFIVADGEGEFESINIFSNKMIFHDSDLEDLEICPERGLISQNYCCSDCGNGISSKDSIKCDFSGNYLCSKCHGCKESVNPLRIIRNWDFKLYPISKKSKKIIVEISYNNLINFPKLNPKEFKTNEKFENVKKLREKIFKSTEKRLKAVGKSEKEKQMLLLEKLAWPKIHLLTSTDFYTIEDLIEIEKGTFCENVLLPLYNLLKL